MAVWVTEVDSRGGHPPDHAGLLGRLAEERERLDALSSQTLRSGEYIGERHRERDVELHTNRRRTDRPQTEHRLPRLPDPVKRSPTLRQLERDCQPDHISVEGHRATEV